MLKMKRIINTVKSPKAIGPYSQAVLINGSLFISGQIPLDPVTNQITGGNIKEQTVQVLKNADAILKEAGYSFNDVVKTTCYLADMNDFQAMNEVYAHYFPADPPARAAVEVSRLPKDVRIEIEMIAVK